MLLANAHGYPYYLVTKFSQTLVRNLSSLQVSEHFYIGG